MPLLCIKSLYKSTYRRNAFVKNKRYEVTREEDEFVWVKDELGHEFTFSRKSVSPFYVLADYFQV